MTLGIDRSSVEAADVASQPTPSDADQHVADEVRAAFMRDDAVASVVDRVKIAARGGVVVLSGRVHTVRQRDLLIGDARAVRGVARVDSRLIAAGD